MAHQKEAFDGEWEDSEGNPIAINGKSVSGPAGIELDIAFESDKTCLMQMGEEFYEGGLSEDGSRIEWSDGEVWKRRYPKRNATDKSSKESAHNDTQVAQRSGVLTLEEALAIQEDLRKGFSRADFQARLRGLSWKYPDRGPQYVSARNDLFLEVQGNVLPSYGFSGTQQGVVDMLRAAALWNGNKQFRENRDDLNQLLGLISQQDEKQKPTKQPSSGSVLHNPHTDLGSAHKPLLLPSSLRLNLPQASLRNQRPDIAASKTKVLQADNGNSSIENLGVAQMAQPAHQLMAQNVEIRAREALGDLEITVALPETASFAELKEEISRHVGRPDIMKRGHLVHNVNGTYLPFKSTDNIGLIREVLVLRASLVVHDDHEAQSWRQTLQKDISDRRVKHEERLIAASKRQEAMMQCGIDVATKGNECPPHGKCFLVGTWDDCTEKHEMMWDGVSYRIGMNLQGTTEVSFQIAAHDSWDSRIYPSKGNAGPDVAHEVLGPARIDSENYWTVHVKNAGAGDDRTYEIVLNCPVDHPMSLAWERVSLDSISWYPAMEPE